MSNTWSPELTFLPVRAPHEIVNRKRGERLVARINNWLISVAKQTGVWMVAKLDPHHDPYGPKETYLVEIVPTNHFDIGWLEKDNPDHMTFMTVIEAIFVVLKQRFGLVPSLTTHDKKRNVDLVWPSGGCHLQMGADLYSFRTDWYRLMERFHKNLAMDYANKPFIRWLLAHWMGDGGSRVIIDPERMAVAKELPKEGAITRDTVFERALFYASSIEPRYMASGKNSYLTFEFRIVGMVENARQLRAAVLLIKAWMDQIKEKKGCLSFNLTQEKWDDMTKEEPARDMCRDWVRSLGLNWADYETDFFARNYLMRVKHGKFV